MTRRSRFAELRIAILDEYYVAHLETGATSEVIADLSRLVADHPLRESLWSSLITAQYRAGRQADALRSFEELRRLLAETAGLSPSPQLQQLQTQVLGTRSGAAHVGVCHSGPSPRRSRESSDVDHHADRWR